MLVSKTRLTTENAGCEISADVKFDTFWVWGDEPFKLWYKFPLELAPEIDPTNGDSFVAALLAPAMVLGETLEIDAEVSPKLMSALDDIQSVYRSWYPELNRIEVKAPLRREIAPERALNNGAFFSLGVDSFYTLLKHLPKHNGSRESLTHIVTVEGFDVYLWEEDRYPEVFSNFNRVGQELGVTPMRVATNLREFSDRVVDWLRLYHGAALASVGLFLQSSLGTMRIASTHAEQHLRPLGSHPSLDPLWSTERLSFIHDGCEATRLEKLKVVSRSRVALETVRVCSISEASAVYNCGRCRKCLMTMVGLHIVGALKRCKTLPDEIDCELLRSIHIGSPGQRLFLAELVEALGDSLADKPIKHALEECLNRFDAPVMAHGVV